MGLQPKRVPNAPDGHVTQANRFRHVGRAPVRGAWRRRFQRPNDYRFDLLIGDGAFRARPRFAIQPVEALSHKRPRYLQTVAGVTGSRRATTVLSVPRHTSG